MYATFMQVEIVATEGELDLIADLQAFWTYIGLGADVATYDGNGNGIPDAAELRMIEAALGDAGLDFTDRGGIWHRKYGEIWGRFPYSHGFMPTWIGNGKGRRIRSG